jgi:hypothetical protein
MGRVSAWDSGFVVATAALVIVAIEALVLGLRR